MRSYVALSIESRSLANLPLFLKIAADSKISHPIAFLYTWVEIVVKIPLGSRSVSLLNRRKRTNHRGLIYDTIVSSCIVSFL